MVSAVVPQLPRVDRISDRSTFSRLRVDAVRARSGPLSFRYVVLPDTDGLGVGYAIGRTVGSAVVRNRLRRQLRAIFSGLAQAEVTGSSPSSSARLAPGAMLVMVRPAAAKLDFPGLTAATHRGLSDLVAGVAASTTPPPQPAP